MKEFKDTFDRFSLAISCYDLDLSTYDGWRELPDKLRTAGLYVQFYNQITLAYQKNKQSYPFIEEATALSTLLQYLMKTTSKILFQPSRYTPAYMYTVAFNAIYPLGRILRDVESYRREVSLIGEDYSEYGSFDLTLIYDDNNYTYSELGFMELAVAESVEDVLDHQEAEAIFFALLESLDDPEYRLAISLINNGKAGSGKHTLRRLAKLREIFGANQN